MANCKKCNAPLSLSERLMGSNGLCNKCKNGEKEETEREIKLFISKLTLSKQITDEQLNVLKKYPKSHQIEVYNSLLSIFNSDSELDTNEISVLDRMINKLDFTYDEVKFTDTVYPYYFVAYIRENDRLPETSIGTGASLSQVVLKKGEIYHYGYLASLREKKVVNVGYSGGSAGVSVPVVKGVRFHVGKTRGHIIKNEQLVETSRGLLAITSQRVLLTPIQGFKPVSIPINKILTYSCYSNGIEIFKEGREKGYTFFVPSQGSVEIMGICLSHLLSQ